MVNYSMWKILITCKVYPRLFQAGSGSKSMGSVIYDLLPRWSGRADWKTILKSEDENGEHKYRGSDQK